MPLFMRANTHLTHEYKKKQSESLLSASDRMLAGLPLVVALLVVLQVSDYFGAVSSKPLIAEAMIEISLQLLRSL